MCMMVLELNRGAERDSNIPPIPFIPINKLTP